MRMLPLQSEKRQRAASRSARCLEFMRVRVLGQDLRTGRSFPRNCIFVPTIIAMMVVLYCGSGTAVEQPVFEQATPGRVLIFPRDHGKHPEFQTEWWYFTGNLDSDPSRRWGFQLTFFRRSLVSGSGRGKSVWAVRDLYPAHLAITDVDRAKFFHAGLLSREGPGLAGASDNDLQVHVKNWSARRQGETIVLEAKNGKYEIKLTLEPEKKPVLHGRAGFSRKGDSAGQASYYYSLTRLKASGEITFAGERHKVSGLAWMDQEFGSSILSDDQAGWDWFSLQLEDGSELMVFHLRKRSGGTEQPFGTLVHPDGQSVDLAGRPIVISSFATWKSPATSAIYPSAWDIEIPHQALKLKVVPLLADQELQGGGPGAGVTYWEGAVSVTGTRNGRAVSGRGYVELTGYAHSLGGRL